MGSRDDGRAGAGLQSWGCHPGAGCPGEGLVVGAGGRAASLVPLHFCESKCGVSCARVPKEQRAQNKAVFRPR